MKYLDQDVISSAIVQDKPFKWCNFSNIIKQEFQEKLIDSYPLEGFKLSSRLEGSKKHYQFQVMKLIEKDMVMEEQFFALTKEWQEFIKELYSENYINLVFNLLGIEAKNYRTDIGLFKYDIGDWVSPHIDNKGKYFTQLFYFNNSWEDIWGGELLIHEGPGIDQVIMSFLPDIKSSILFKCDDNAWHSVFPVTKNAKQQRVSLQLEVWTE